MPSNPGTSIASTMVDTRARHAWQHGRVWQSKMLPNGYPDGVPVSRAVINSRFSAWVGSVMRRARERGMTDKDIEQATGVPIRTLHHWQANELGPQGPTPRTVYAFCDGMGEKRTTAAGLLDWSVDETVTDAPTIELPTAPPEVHQLLRTLNDPNVSKREKDYIRETLRRLAERKVARTAKRGPRDTK